MIINGGQAGNVGWWTKHLQRDDTNTRAEVMEIKGLLAEDLESALKEMKAIADQSRSRGNFMYQANLNPEANERLTPEQWQQAIDILEKKLGFEGLQRIVVEHEKHGRVHRHVIWNRVDVDTLKVADITNNYEKHVEAAREIEHALDLSPTPAPSQDQKLDRAPELWEIRAAERSGIDPAEVRAEMTGLWRTTDSGKAFAAAVDERGYILARGDRRDFCVVDHAGDAHSLARRIEDAKAKDVRERMADIDRDSLPTVPEARARQRERNPTPEAVRDAWQGRNRDAAPTQQPERDKAPQPQPEARPEPDAADLLDDWRQQWQQRRIDARAQARAERQEQAHADWLERAQDQRARRSDDPLDRATVATKDTIRNAIDDPLGTAKNVGMRALDSGLGAVPAAKAGLQVFDASTGAIDLLGSFVDRLLGGGPKIPAGAAQQIVAQRRARAAMEHIRRDIEAGRNLRASDIEALTPTHLENIKRQGDGYVMEMVESMERRRREKEREHERER